MLVQDVVDPTDPGTAVVFWLGDDSEAGYTEYTVTPDSAAIGDGGLLRYMSFDPDSDVVTFQYVSNVYRVVEGTMLGFTFP